MPVKEQAPLKEEPELNFSGMAKRWASDFVARESVGQFTGGLIHPRTCANLDCKGLGCKRKIRFGKKIAYPVVDFVEWLNARIRT